MREHPHYGLVLPEHGWVPSPRYVMRRDRILEKVQLLAPGRALEIGCGVGALLHDLARRGYACEALETSPDALTVATQVLGHHSDVRLHATPEHSWVDRFDLVLALEVLEHIEDDRGALQQWVDWIAPGGHLILSVPAHQRRWNPTDEWAGHFRRYESAGLRDLLSQVGLRVLDVDCYGFPLANLLEHVRAATWQRGRSTEDAAQRAQRTATSGTNRSVESRLFPLQASLPGTLAMRALCRVQRAFARTELGNGFLVMAQKPPVGTSA